MKNEVEMLSTSKVMLMCGPAGAGKSTFAKQLESKGMTILSYDKESFKRGLKVHPLSEDLVKEIKRYLDEKLKALIEQNIDVVLDYSFWSRATRMEYISFLKKYGIEPRIYYIKTHKEVIMERIRNRDGRNENEIILSEETAALYYEHFQEPTFDECEVIVVEGF